MADAYKTIPKRRILTADVNCGDGAVMSIPDPQAKSDGGLEWVMRYGDAEAHRFDAARVVESYDYLCCDAITMAEATRRLQLMRAKWKERAHAK